MTDQNEPPQRRLPLSGRGSPNPRCEDCQPAQLASDGNWLPGQVCDRHAYDPVNSVDADPDGMGSADMWREGFW